MDNAQKLVVIFGGSGFLGRHIVRALAKQGWRIRVACRRPNLAGYLQPMGSVGQIHAVQANVRYPRSVEAAIAGADAVINLTGILYQTGRQKFDAVQASGAGTIARAAKAAGITQFVHFSAIGADENSESAYARSKAAGEAAVLTHVPTAVIFRPSIVFGPEDDFFNRFAKLATFLPFLPLIGGGHTKFQPVFVGDVAKAVVAALSNEAKTGTVYELGGPEVKSFKELLQLTAIEVHRPNIILLPLPFFAAKLQASVLQLLPKPMLTVDQVKLLAVDNVVSLEAIQDKRNLEGLHIAPTALASVLPSYLWRYRVNGQYAKAASQTAE